VNVVSKKNELYDLIKNTPKNQLLKYAKEYCKHGHNLLSHLSCLKEALAQEQRIGFLDIESEDLNADYGLIFCYCIKDLNSNKIYEDRITLDDIKKYKSKSRDAITKEDKRVIENLVKDMHHFDRIVTHYGSKFDLNFIRTRAVMVGVDFPAYGLYTQTDTWKILINKFKLSRNSLENACRHLLGDTRKDRLSLAIKHGCLRGEEWAIQDALVHCRKDVLDTQDLYLKICDFVKETKTSI
jgi:uncharacterized protein YprB with RNaseH-like and TPR domain